jgi:hypothetical protein
MRALLAGNLPRRHAFKPRTEHLAGLTRQLQLRARSSKLASKSALSEARDGRPSTSNQSIGRDNCIRDVFTEFPGLVGLLNTYALSGQPVYEVVRAKPLELRIIGWVAILTLMDRPIASRAHLISLFR